MKYWSRFPVFRVVIPFASGILFCINSNGPITGMLIFTLVVSTIAWLFTIRNYATGKYANRWLAGFPVYACFLGLGFTVTWFSKSIHFSGHFPGGSAQTYYVIELKRPPSETKKGLRLYAKVTAWKNQDAWQACRGNLLVYVNDTTHQLQVSTGDRLLIAATPQRVPEPLNPGAFNYREYLESIGVYYQCFLKFDDISIIEKATGFSLPLLADRLRMKMVQRLDKFIDGRDRLGVAGALLLGYEEWLDPELEDRYSAAGVLHILCVSGMHVGLIYVIFSWMLSWMNAKRILKQLQFPVLIGFVWFYSMVTGLSPSVVRASTMLTFVIAGKWIDKNSSIYNNLCSSCVVMFAVDPFLLVSAGFQLSFLAVCGIVIFHQLIFPLWNAPGTLLHKTWELISISLAAQLSTFPLSLYLFHQFPNYFIIGNLVLIPLSTIVMYSGIALLVTGWIPAAGELTGSLTAILIDALNYSVDFISQLPGALTENISLSFVETVLIYLMMAVFTLWLVMKGRVWLFTWQIILIVFLGYRITYFMTAGNQQLFTVYHHKNQSIFTFVDGRRAVVFTDTSSTSGQLKYTIGGHLTDLRIADTMMIKANAESITQLGKGEFTIIRDWHKNAFPAETRSRQKVNTLILSGQINVPADTILKYFVPEMVVFDPSLKSYRQRLLKESFTGAGVKIFDVKKEGAFIRDW